MSTQISQESIKAAQLLNDNGFELKGRGVLPAIGFGTWALAGGYECVKLVRDAILCGYRLIDGAALYGNEVEVGKGIAASGVDREELFITSKVKEADMGYQSTKDAFFKTLTDLDLEYLDLYLIHWPASESNNPKAHELNLATWKAMTELYEEGYIMNIGVSNFKEHHLMPLMETKVKPMVNQLEIHPGFSQLELVRFCQANEIVPEAWSPMGRQRVFDNDVLKAIASECNRTVAQVCLRFVNQLGIPSIPKSSTIERMKQNMDIFDFELNDEQMERILVLDEQNLGFSGLDPDKK